MQYKLRIGEIIYPVDIEDITARPVIATVQGKRYEVWPENSELPPPIPSEGKLQTVNTTPSQTPCPPPSISLAGTGSLWITAPIPGVIVTLNVKPGETVFRGDELCVLEAMKMKNSIRSARDGMIKSISVSVGEQVSHGQTLLEFTD